MKEVLYILALIGLVVTIQNLLAGEHKEVIVWLKRRREKRSNLK